MIGQDRSALRNSLAWTTMSIVLLTPIFANAQVAGGQKQPSSRTAESPPRGHWISRTSRDEMTDSVGLIVSVDAAAPIRVSFNVITPRLSIECNSGKLNIAFYVGGASQDETMDLRFDDGDVITLDMIMSTNLRWLFVPDFGDHDVPDILTRLSHARRLRTRFTPFVESPVTFSFDVAGLSSFLPRLERAGCRTTEPAPIARADNSEDEMPRGATANAGIQGTATGVDVGVDFPFPGYLTNVDRQITIKFKPLNPAGSLNAAIRFLIHRDGSVSDLQFIRRSGNFSFDLEAQGAVEAAASARAFGPLPNAFSADMLPVVHNFGPELTANQGGGGQTYFEFQVEKPAEILQGSVRPKYPSVLESSGLAGEVQAQFVVTSQGTADMDSFKVLKSTNELFTQAVKNVLPRMQFSPATIGGKAVSQLVQRSFNFRVGDQVPERERSYRPTARDLFIPPMPAPQAVKGFHMTAIFDVDEKGNSKLVSFTQTSDVAYNKRVEEVLRSMRFRPGVRADGTPQRDTATIEIVF